MRRFTVRYAVAGVIGILSIASAIDAAAQVVSPAITPSRIQVDEPIRQGSTLRLPGLGVMNQSDEAARYRMNVTPVRESEALEVHPSWVRLQPSTFDLEPGAGQQVVLWLDIPGDAPPGNYRTRLRATVEPTAPAEGIAVAVRAAVATDLRFTVVEHHATFFGPLIAWVNRNAAPLGASIGLVSAALLALEARDRYGLRLLLVRRQRDG